MSAFLLLPSELDESDIDWLNRKLEERLRAHLAAKYLYRAVMSADASSGASAKQAADGNMVDAGQTTGPANPALSPEPQSEEEQLTHERADREAAARLADLKRRRPWDFAGRDEEDYPQDDSDIQPYERTTSYPWGGK